MSDLHFAQPGWVHLLWGVLAFVALLAWLERRGGDALRRFVSRGLQARLLIGPGPGQRAARLLFLAAAGGFLTLALMRPQWGLHLEQSQRAGAEIMICLDVSRSMLAEDVVPNRLQRAKAEIRDLLELLDGDQVGLIAFAGRASVLSPLTPDFGFLRLALDEAGPGSVSRGGTRLEEPVRKAIAGFGDGGGASRAIVLITDGEDHDSFPLEAAKAAAERGVRILAVGFGAEAGAEIPITDPASGARTLLTDADGKAVRSRLDGDLLRDMALATGGAYIPAGTGVLDLTSIYRRHIAPLTRGQLDGRARAVRNDAFQWAVLLGLLALLGAVSSTVRAPGREPARLRPVSPRTGRGRGTAGGIARAVTLAAALSVALLPGPGSAPAWAQTGPDGGEGPAREAVSAVPPAAAGDAPPAAEALPEDPRAAYNLGVERLADGDPAAAGRLLEAARTGAGTDAELRFRATYNLGWVEVRSADLAMDPEPARALEHLQRAGAWFRDAVALRPGNDDARHNLEVVMRRVLQLSDSLAGNDDQDLLAGLEAVIDEQRGFLADLREGVAAQQSTSGADVSPELRRRFRNLAARELGVLSQTQRLGERAAREQQGLQANTGEPGDGPRAARLEAVVGHLYRAGELIAQARSRIRRVQGERAYRRAAAALAALKRARDPLVDPGARLDALLADGVEVARLTDLEAAARAGIDGTSRGAPPWLTTGYLGEAQAEIHARTEELGTELSSVLTAPGTGAGGTDAAAGGEPARRAEALRQAAPLVGRAAAQFEAAVGALAAEQLGPALEAQRRGLEALAAAREELLDLRRLIERVHGQEQQVATLIEAAPPPGAPPATGADPQPDDEAVALGASLHERNVERALRLSRILSDEMTRPPSEAHGGGASAGPPASGRNQQLERGYALLGKALESMHAASRGFQALADGAGDPRQALAATRGPVQDALLRLSELRRLFFSVLEHLRDTARRQQGLNDDTEAVAALANPGTPRQGAGALGPLAHRQEGLAGIATGIGEALRSQAESPPAAEAGAQAAAPAERERLTTAAQLVAAAATRMGEAAGRLGGAAPALDEVRQAQDQALAGLAEAIALFEQPGDRPRQGEQQAQEQEQPADGQGGPPRQADEAPGQGDLAQLLQGVRDREARRREARARQHSRQGYEPVEKDW